MRDKYAVYWLNLALPMDLYQIIRLLYEEMKRLDHLIAVLEELERAPEHSQTRLGKKRPGRKTISAEARRQLSDRMKRYWSRRKQEARPQQDAPAPPHLDAATG